MLLKEILSHLDVGASVAEQDTLLRDYFVETDTFHSLIRDRTDVIAGDKGTGKTALYKVLSESYVDITELRHIEVVSAFNPVGAPVFQRLAEGEILTEEAYINVWKSYFLALGGNWILEIASGDYTDQMAKLHEILEAAGLRTPDDSPNGVFSKIVNRLKRTLRVKSLDTKGKIGPAELGLGLEFATVDSGTESAPIQHDRALHLLDRVLREMGITLWLVVDRLDEAFQSRPQLERPALRALLRTYLDMQEFQNIRLKLFVRKDLFGRIISGGFVNLTHVNARKKEVMWEEADLYSLLYKRAVTNKLLLDKLGLETTPSPDQLFSTLFPAQVDPGSRRPGTWAWMMSRISDGGGTKPPRNLIDLVSKARDAQLRQEEREPREYQNGVPLISSDALKRGLEALSAERVEDTLIAEAGDYAEVIELFRGGKAEHNQQSLQELLGVNHMEKSEHLAQIGFLERIGESFKVPMLYRGGLKITQGKAFTSS